MTDPIETLANVGSGSGDAATREDAGEAPSDAGTKPPPQPEPTAAAETASDRIDAHGLAVVLIFAAFFTWLSVVAYLHIWWPRDVPMVLQ